MIIITLEKLNTPSNIIHTHTNKVGIYLDRSEAMISSLYSCYKNNITYIPLDTQWPYERINSIIRETDLKCIITTRKYSKNICCENIITVENEDVVHINDSFPNNDIAYILYTSGSTGSPKGVEITKSSLENFINGVSKIINFSKGKRIICLTTVSFDIFFLESIMPLCKEMTVIFANEEEQRNPKLMAYLISDNNVDMVQMTPSRMQLLINYDPSLLCLKNVSEIMLGGESLPLTMLQDLQKNTSAQIYNMYGPTETTIWSTISNLTNKDHVDIGVPIFNTEVFIIDQNLNILPNNTIGEICIAGKGLANGYVKQNELSSEKFIYLPQFPNKRVYRTGDLGKYREDGCLECIGRIDNQIKIRGYRIEPEEIEFHLNQFVGINQSIVTSVEKNGYDKVLVAYYTSKFNIEPDDIIYFLSNRLPSYMIPTSFIRIEQFEYTANGKIDRKKILIYKDEVVLNNEHLYQPSVFTSPIKDRIRIIIENCLNEKLDNESWYKVSFENIGLDSINFIKLIVALEDEFEFEFDDNMLTISSFPTIDSMVTYIESKRI